MHDAETGDEAMQTNESLYNSLLLAGHSPCFYPSSSFRDSRCMILIESPLPSSPSVFCFLSGRKRIIFSLIENGCHFTMVYRSFGHRNGINLMTL